jgi:superfamily I DNA and RNA helicase
MVYRAKGNEAAAVFAVGIDAIETESRNGRNKIFTASTVIKRAHLIPLEVPGDSLQLVVPLIE